MAKKKEIKEQKVEKTTVTVIVLAHNMAGKYGLPYNAGSTVEMEAKQAKELIDAGDAKAK